MKNVPFVILCLFIISCSTSKLKSYGHKGSDKYATIKTQAEYVSLKITPVKGGSELEANAILTGVYGIILDQLVNIPSYIKKGIKNTKKKYTQTYSAHNSLTFETVKYTSADTCKNAPIFTLPSIELKRKIFYNEKGKDKNAIACSIVFTPVEQKGNDSLFVFQLSAIDMKYTKAKTTKKYPYVNLIIEIKATYSEKDANGKLIAKEYVSKNIILPIRNGVNLKDILGKGTIYSSPFKIEGLKNIEVKVTETNPYYLKLEELETMVGDNEEDLSGFFEELSKLLKKE